MEKIILGRGCGKTTELIKRSAEIGACIVCKSQHEAKRIKSIAEKIGLEISSPITYVDLIKEKNYDSRHNGFLIDGIESFLQEAVWGKVIGFTANPSEPYINNEPKPSGLFCESVESFKIGFGLSAKDLETAAKNLKY